MLSVTSYISNIYSGFKEINSSTLSGAIDVIIVEQEDGTYKSGPFHVIFGKLGALTPTDKNVEIYVNGHHVDTIHMRLGSNGDAYFVDNADSPNVESDSEFPAISRSRSVEDIPFPSTRKTKKRAKSDEKTSSLFIKGEDLNVASTEDLSLPENSNSESEFYQSNNATNITWEWGSFPEKVENEPTNDALDSSLNELPASPISTCGGLYLDDIDKIDFEDKKKYIYSKKSNKCLTDAGYKSDGENSNPSSENLCTQFSLCGNLNSSLTMEKFYAFLVTYEEFIKDPSNILNNPNLVVLFNSKFYNWQTAAPLIMCPLVFRTELPHRVAKNLEETYMPKPTSKKKWFIWGYGEKEKMDNWSEENKEQSQVIPIVSETKETTPEPEFIKVKKRNRLTDNEIDSLDLKPGHNDIEFRLVSQYQGTYSCMASIFLWDYKDKIIVSDVDGTITKSDILGHVLPLIGRDWTHEHVAKLFGRLQEHGYQFIYLSARALGQSSITRGFLRDIIQEDRFKLPVGPVLLSPTSILHAFHQEVIVRTPEKFKISCLADVKNLFPSCSMPLYAGFGNKVNDALAYKEVGIDIKRIFIINPKSIITNEFVKDWSSSYKDLYDYADHFFPYYKRQSNDELSQVDYSDFNYWNMNVNQNASEEEDTSISQADPLLETTSLDDVDEPETPKLDKQLRSSM